MNQRRVHEVRLKNLNLQSLDIRSFAYAPLQLTRVDTLYQYIYRGCFILQSTTEIDVRLAVKQQAIQRYSMCTKDTEISIREYTRNILDLHSILESLSLKQKHFLS